MLRDLSLAGEADRKARPELGAKRRHERVRGAIQPVVLALGIDDQALCARAHGRHRDGCLGGRLSAIGKRPRAHRHPGFAQSGNERR
ncbi:MAG: hypothetical protein ACYDHN_08450 [Solirubrobacteraceae bacterium]